MRQTVKRDSLQYMLEEASRECNITFPGELHTPIIDEFCYYPQITSTQDQARKIAAAREVLGKRVGFGVVATSQRRGRGRLGRVWRDDGHGLCFTLAIHDSYIGTARTPGEMSLIAGLAAMRACRERSHNISIGLKWPNDIVFGSRGNNLSKLGGILIEKVGSWWLIGVGINITQPTGHWRSTPLHNRACSLRMLGMKTLGRSFHTAVHRRISLAVCVVQNYVMLLQDMNILNEWKRYDLLTGASITMKSDDTVYHGRVLNIEPLEYIELSTNQGTVRLPAQSTHRIDEIG